MARDYKNAKRSGSSGSNKNGFAWGLTLGLTVAIGVYIYDHHVDPRRQNAALNESEPATKGEQRTPASQSDEPQTKFDFYEALPKAEVVIPKGKSDAVSGTAQHSEKNAAVVVQAGSYRTFAEADRVRASLALQGVESKVSEAVIGTDTWHRVRVGPLRDPKQVDETLRILREARIDARAMPAGN